MQAIGFYIAYLVLILLVGGVLGGIGGVIAEENSFEIGVVLGTIAAVVICLIFGILVVSKKNQWSNFLSIVLVVLSPLLALFIGGIGGLLPVAYLTTLDRKSISDS